MNISLIDEQLVSLREAAGLLPSRRRGKRPHVSCLYRWTTTGCRGVTLESVAIGGTRCTSREARQRFFARLTELGSTGTIARTADQNRVQSQIEREFDAAGIGISPQKKGTTTGDVAVGPHVQTCRLPTISSGADCAMRHGGMWRITQREMRSTMLRMRVA